MDTDESFRTWTHPVPGELRGHTSPVEVYDCRVWTQLGHPGPNRVFEVLCGRYLLWTHLIRIEKPPTHQGTRKRLGT